MKIFIITDSRGEIPRGNTWIEKLQSLLSPKDALEVDIVRAGIEAWSLSIKDFPYPKGFLEKTYDFILVNDGIRDHVGFWAESFRQSVMGGKFKKEHLITPFEYQGKTLFHYFDEKGEMDAIELLRQRGKHVLFVGLHTIREHGVYLRNRSSLELFDEDVLKMNDFYSSQNVDFFHMPMDNVFPRKNTVDVVSDGVHYNNDGHAFVAKYVLQYINHVDDTLPSILTNFSKQERFNNRKLFERAVEIGKGIAQTTQQGDVVLLARQTCDDLFATFIGCILFKRKPLIVQRPSVKVHADIFNKRMTDLKNKVLVALCICEAEDVESYSPYFTCQSEIPSSTDEIPFPECRSDEIAFLQMSSGTTGVSKVCEITHKQLIFHCLTYGEVIGLDSSKSVVSWLPLYHDMGLIAAFLLPVIVDAPFFTLDPFQWLLDPKQILQLAAEKKGTHMWMPNFAFRHLTNKVNPKDIKDLDLSSLEKVISCSEPTFAHDLQKFGERFASLKLNPQALTNCYALAENIFAVSQSDGLKTHEWKGIGYTSCGKVIPGVSVLIVRDGKDVTHADDGQIMIKSSYTPKTNIVSDFHGYYDTGDIGFMIDNELYVIGRSKDAFVSYGVNVYPEIIEHRLGDIEGIIPGRVVCFGVPVETLGTEKVYICAETENINNPSLMLKISSVTKAVFDISPIVKLVTKGELVKTSSGKLSRVENRKRYGN